MKPQRGVAARLAVLDSLEVGPVRLERRRLIAPYRVTRDGASEETELVYRFEQEVFSPRDPSDQNLATMIAAQVALNYGLFCRRLRIHGPLDEVDREFLATMAENTAREIYVKKILQENPFLVPELQGLEAESLDRYCQAEIELPDAVGELPVAEWGGEAGTRADSRYMVLASGGKDSLLSTGLLREANRAPGSVFVNESGRHWYTALNAFRGLRGTEPERTWRVWTSSDRVFTWMLRRLPFVRPDFAQLRSDEYPIRLWTVAVFLFGALPVLRRHGVDRLIIGDEYDTTRRARYKGISHYDGLYDQSRYFDDALSRYYRRKGWPLAQLSLLRPMSEMLIQKTLAERYPDLHRLQVSCHAASVRGDRVEPCGRCEKCRRIVAMHVALGLDAARCGYSKEVQERCLASLAEAGVHQETAGAEHLAWLLRERGLLAEGPGTARPRRHPEIMQLRFHDDVSPVDVVPQDLRRPLWSTLLAHADGAVIRRGRAWQTVDPLADAMLARPWRGGPERKGKRADPAAGGEGHDYLLGELTWPQARRRLREVDTALLPVGAIEQHGHHLPLDIDAWDADYLCRRVAERCSSPRPLVLPLIPYGVSYHHAEFPGTLSVAPETLAQLVYEVGMSAAGHGILKLVIVNGHGGNAPTLQFAAQKINRDAHIFTCVDTGETSDADIDELTQTPNDAHAGEIETSTALATRPQLVDMTRAQKAVPRFSSQYLDWSSKRSVEWYAYTGRISRSGVLGDPTVASREKGEKIWEVMIQRLVEFVEAIKALSLAEIHERRQ